MPLEATIESMSRFFWAVSLIALISLLVSAAPLRAEKQEESRRNSQACGGCHWMAGRKLKFWISRWGSTGPTEGLSEREFTL
jgi:hypothetical protein